MGWMEESDDEDGSKEREEVFWAEKKSVTPVIEAEGNQPEPKTHSAGRSRVGILLVLGDTRAARDACKGIRRLHAPLHEHRGNALEGNE